MPPQKPDIADLPGGRSFSIGPPNGGWLLRGTPLPLRSAAHRVLPGTARRGWNYGTDRLIQLILESAARVSAACPDSVLRVGNLSRPGGGRIAPSVSHQSGRDADIGLYVTDLDDKPVDAPGFPKFDGSRGPLVDRTGRFLFDVERNWAFVEALLHSKRARMQWIFLDTPLEEALLDYAIRTGRDPQLIDKAEKIIVRPQNSSPHAEHFHIRIFCDEVDLEYGCKDLGPEWGWVKEERESRRQLLDDRVDRIMKGEETLNLQSDDAGGPAEASRPEPKATEPSIDDLPDPPTNVPFKME